LQTERHEPFGTINVRGGINKLADENGTNAKPRADSIVD
jgi:hypothetical protein